MRLRSKGIRIPVVRGSVTAKLLGIDQIDYRRHITDSARKAEKMGLVQIKPGRVPGGVWMDPYVSARRTVHLCSLCSLKYGKAILSRGYRIQPPWLTEIYSDCDGCGETTIKVTRYIPEETYFRSLIGARRRGDSK